MIAQSKKYLLQVLLLKVDRQIAFQIVIIVIIIIIIIIIIFLSVRRTIPYSCGANHPNMWAQLFKANDIVS